MFVRPLRKGPRWIWRSCSSRPSSGHGSLSRDGYWTGFSGGKPRSSNLLTHYLYIKPRFEAICHCLENHCLTLNTSFNFFRARLHPSCLICYRLWCLIMGVHPLYLRVTHRLRVHQAWIQAGSKTNLGTAQHKCTKQVWKFNIVRTTRTKA